MTTNNCAGQNLAVRRVAGVTLIELLVTLAILSILMTVAVPSLSEFVAENRQSNRVFELVGVLNLARSEAIKRGVRVSICKTRQPEAVPPACAADAGWEQGWIVFVDNTQDAGNSLGIIDGGDAVVKIIDAEPEIPITTGGNYARGVSYRYDGISQGIKANGKEGTANDTFTLCRGGKAMKAIINNVGRIRISQTNC